MSNVELRQSEGQQQERPPLPDDLSVLTQDELAALMDAYKMNVIHWDQVTTSNTPQVGDLRITTFTVDSDGPKTQIREGYTRGRMSFLDRRTPRAPTLLDTERDIQDDRAEWLVELAGENPRHSIWHLTLVGSPSQVKLYKEQQRRYELDRSAREDAAFAQDEQHWHYAYDRLAMTFATVVEGVNGTPVRNEAELHELIEDLFPTHANKMGRPDMGVQYRRVTAAMEEAATNIELLQSRVSQYNEIIAARVVTETRIATYTPVLRKEFGPHLTDTEIKNFLRYEISEKQATSAEAVIKLARAYQPWIWKARLADWDKLQKTSDTPLFTYEQTKYNGKPAYQFDPKTGYTTDGNKIYQDGKERFIMKKELDWERGVVRLTLGFTKSYTAIDDGSFTYMGERVMPTNARASTYEATQEIITDVIEMPIKPEDSPVKFAGTEGILRESTAGNLWMMASNGTPIAYYDKYFSIWKSAGSKTPVWKHRVIYYDDLQGDPSSMVKQAIAQGLIPATYLDDAPQDSNFKKTKARNDEAALEARRAAEKAAAEAARLQEEAERNRILEEELRQKKRAFEEQVKRGLRYQTPEEISWLAGSDPETRTHKLIRVAQDPQLAAELRRSLDNTPDYYPLRADLLAIRAMVDCGIPVTEETEFVRRGVAEWILSKTRRVPHYDNIKARVLEQGSALQHALNREKLLQTAMDHPDVTVLLQGVELADFLQKLGSSFDTLDKTLSEDEMEALIQKTLFS